MPALTSDNAPAPPFTRNAFFIKDGIIGAFFLNSSERHLLWTWDPRLNPPLYWYEYQTRELVEGRFVEFLGISKQNGWSLTYDGPRNFG